jgi:ABC-type nickel/cobalt efflux system permease component RcnA
MRMTVRHRMARVLLMTTAILVGGLVSSALAHPMADPGVDAAGMQANDATGSESLSPEAGHAPRTVPSDRFTELITQQDLTPALVLFSLVIAFALGGLHALSPGHGKTLVAAYLVGSRGTAKHALLLGAVVTLAHTAGVFLLGFLLLAFSAEMVPSTLLPIMQLVSGMAIAGIGITMFAKRLRDLSSRQRAHAAHDHYAASHAPDHSHIPDHAHAHDHQHDHERDAHSHDHGTYSHDDEHSHGWGGKHSHAIPAGAPTATALLALGVSGGILPCPSALVVLLSAVALHRVGAGLVLILAFSMGLAAVLSGVGILVVRAGTLLARFEGAASLARPLQAFSALFVCVLGLGIAAGALADVHRAFF